MNHCHDCATPVADSETTCVSCGAPIEQIANRQITAPSALINANIRVGPLQFHRLITGVAIGATAALLALGGLYGWAAEPDASLAFIDDTVTAASLNQVANFDSQIVQIASSVCGVTTSQQGLIVGPDIIITPRNETGQSISVQVSKPTNDFAQQANTGSAIGVDDLRNMVVIRSDLEPTSTPFVWRTTTGLRTGDTLFVVLPGHFLVARAGPVRAGFVAVEAVIDSFRSDKDGVPATIWLSSEQTSSFLPGAAVLDETLRLVGVIDQSGQSLNTSDVLQPAVSALVVNPQPPILACEEDSD